MTMTRFACALGVALCTHGAAQAHPSGDSHVVLRPQPDGHVLIQWDVALRDLDDELLLDSDGDGRLQARELTARWPDIGAWAQPLVQLSTPAGPCTSLSSPARAAPAWVRRDGEHHARLRWSVQCPRSKGQAQVRLHYTALSPAPDSPHRAVVRWHGDARAERVLLGGPRQEHVFKQR